MEDIEVLMWSLKADDCHFPTKAVDVYQKEFSLIALFLSALTLISLIFVLENSAVKKVGKQGLNVL